ncbi:MAG: cation-translocating P-type ATPase [Candidatus Ratteibacteria bacterium]
MKKGDVAIIKSGDTIAVDGVVISGSASVNQAPITGESIPVEKNRGDQVFAGSINEQGVLTVEVVHLGDDTTLGKIIRLVEEAESAKAPVQRFADRFSGYFLPVIVGIALLTFLISGKASAAIAILLVGCPCSIALATPLAVVMSIGRNAKEGVLIKGGKHLELLAKSNLLFLDKTGTLTFGRPEITDSISFGSFSEERILFLAASAEKQSEHILAKAFLRKAEEKDISILSPSHFIVYPGMGIQAEVDHSVVLLGNRRLMKTKKIVLLESHEARAVEWEDKGKTVIFLACNGRLEAIVAVQDTIRHGVRESLQRLSSLGMHRIIMITGDNAATAKYIAKTLQIEYQANLLPQDKIAIVREYQKKGYIVTMIGDGINDAPALVAADVGIAMGVAGTDIAIESADIALMGDEWRKIPEAIISARRAFFTIRQNIGFSILFNILGIGLAAIGLLSPLVAAMAHSLPDIAVFLNSSRLLKKE